MKIHFITSAHKKKLIKQLENQFGITKLPYLLTESGKEKIRAFSGHLSKEEISELNHTLNIELFGLYILRQEHNIRLSLDGTHLLNNQLTKNKIQLTDQQALQYLKGQNLEIKKPSGTYVIEHSGLLLGCAKSNSEVLLNHLPKDRRLKK
jgi:NOL1/NOP2/fmu family ribosome biogenesis protein